MNKYIDAEKLIAEIEREKKNLSNHDFGERCAIIAYDVVLSFITSLQQEQDIIMKDYPYMPGWRLNKENNKPAIKHSILMLTTHGVAEGEWNGNEWIQYRWSCKVNDSDVLYWMHLEDLTQLEKEGDFFQQEQPEVDLEKEYKEWWETRVTGNVNIEHTMEWYMHETARHFYELARLKYEK